ncbi:MAG: c-type cytochrome [Ignavibacteriota bacterium]
MVAHELLHIFAETPSHSDHGVDHPSLSPHQLLTDHLEFAELEPTAHIVHTGKVLELPSGSAPQEAGRVSYNRGGCTACHGSNGDGTPHGPALRFAKRKLNSIVLFAKLAKNQDKMCQRARALKVARPSIGEDEITQLVRFLNEF